MATDKSEENLCMPTEPQREHLWLHKFVGEWEYDAEIFMEPDVPPEKCFGTEHVRTLGDFWILAEGQGEMPGGGAATMLMTLGFDPVKKFVGTWVGSMMTHLWIYSGSLSDDETTLTLDSEGPGMSGNGEMAQYRDIITFSGSDQRLLTSQIMGSDGSWQVMMTSRYRRKPGD